MGSSFAFRCEVCDADPEPLWRMTRRGDVATSWACNEHLAIVCARLQRDFEITELVVVLSSKAREWVEIGATLDAVLKSAASGFPLPEDTP